MSEHPMTRAMTHGLLKPSEVQGVQDFTIPYLAPRLHCPGKSARARGPGSFCSLAAGLGIAWRSGGGGHGGGWGCLCRLCVCDF